MKLFIASLATETNTFAPLPTGRPAFLADYARRDGSRNPPRLSNIGLIAWRRLAEADGHEVVESLSTFAQPGGITLRAVYEDLRDALLADLEAAGPVDAVLLFMHGAMVAEGYDDCEGDTLARVRGIVGPGVPVGVELDLHCHLTETMRQAADVMVIYKEYPHTDIVARARDLYPLVIAAAEGRIRPVMAYADCRMVSLWRTSDPPVRRFVDRMSAAEGRDGILSVSFGHGFPWADVADVGAKMLVVADGDEAAAAALARSLAAEVWAMREEAATPYVTIDAAIDRALACDDPRPMVLADVADNAGAGAPSDNTAILRRLVARGVRDAASGLYWDPGAVGICREAGIGARFTLRVGGKCGVTSGRPRRPRRHGARPGGRPQPGGPERRAGAARPERLGRGGRDPPRADEPAPAALRPGRLHGPRPHPARQAPRRREVDAALPRRLRGPRERGALRGGPGRGAAGLRRPAPHQEGRALVAPRPQPLRCRMIPSGLPLDLDAMLATLRPWVECESPTFATPAVNRMMALAARDLAVAGARIEVVPGRMGLGDCVRARFPHPRPETPGILVLGHMDTVHPVGTLEVLPWRREGGRVHGPGILDMKGGNLLALEAIRALGRAGIATPLPVTVLLTGDEEIGSPSTRDLIEAEASRHRYVLVPEPGHEDNGVVTGRYAIARFVLEATGRPSHAGARLGEGRSAVRAFARKILAIEAMSGEDCTFSVGIVQGGQWVNCVPTRCRGEALSMAKRQADLDRGVARMLALSGTEDDVAFTVTRGVTRPVWEPDAETLALYETARALAAAEGLALPHRSAGGGSDGNFTGAMGIPTLDGLGAIGRGYHTLEEQIDEASLVSRARLFAGLLAMLR